MNAHLHRSFLRVRAIDALMLVLSVMLVMSVLSGASLQAEVLFRADFDGQMDPSVSAGRGTAAVSGTIRYVDGIENKAAVLTSESKLSYEAAKNIDLGAGTIQMWIKPLNWSWQAEPFVEFFRLDNTADDRSALRLYKYLKPGKDFGLVWLAGRVRQEAEKPQWTVVKKPIMADGRGEWCLLSATWDRASRVITLFIDGEEAGYATVPENQLPRSLAERFFVLNTTTAPFDKSFETAVDLLEIHDAALSADEIRSSFQRMRPAQAPAAAVAAGDITPSFVAIPWMNAPPRIDGHYGADEWSDAASVGGFSVFNQTKSPADRQTTVHAGHDGDFLYVAYLSMVPSGGALVADATSARDGKLSRDDAFELLLAPEREGGPIFQVVGNSKGVCAGLKGAHFAKMAPGWECPAQVASLVYEQRWLAELAIPLREVGLAKPVFPKQIRLNFVRNWSGSGSDGGILQTAWSFASHSFAEDLGSATLLPKDSSYARMLVDAKALEQRRFSGQLLLRNPASGREEELTAAVEARDATGRVLESATKTLSVSPRSEAEFPFDLPVEAPNALVGVRVVRPGGEPLLRHEVPLQYPTGLVITPMMRADTKTIEVHVQFAGVVEPDPALSGVVELHDAHAKTVSRAALDMGPNRQSGEATLSVADVPDGDYRITARIMKEGRVVAEQAKPLEKMLDPVWLKERPGISRQVLPPWTAMKHADRTISCWGREYAYRGDSLLPSKILSGERDVLAAPASIIVGVSGKEQPLPAPNWVVEEQADDRIVVVGEQKGRDIALKARTVVEYDGMARVELTVAPVKQRATIDRLQLRLPLAQGRDTFIHAHSFAWSNKISKRLPEDFHSPFFPSLWIGAEERGLAWFAESDQHWATERPERVFEAPTRKGVVDLTINIVDRSLVLEKPLTYVFGFQATPVKPPLAAHRTLRLHNPGTKELSPWAARDKSIKKYAAEDPEWGWLAPHVGDFEKLRSEIDHAKTKRGAHLPIYVAPTITSPLSPSYQVFKDRWRNPHGSYPFACAASTFTDELIWQLDQMRKRSGLEAVYIDCGWAYSCGNRHHGCGYVDEEGRVRLTYPIFALREEFKRIYTLFHAPPSSAPAPVWAHASGLATAPVHSFVDTLTQGEEVRRDVVANPKYFQIYDLDTWRITYGTSLGIEMNFLPELCIAKDLRADPDTNAAFVALALLHDTPFMDGFSNGKYLLDVFRPLDAAGIQDPRVVFTPYWSQRFVEAENAAHVKASAYQLPTQALVVVANPAPAETTVNLKFHPESLGWSGREVDVSMLVSNRCELKNGHSLTLRPENFVVLKVTPK